MGDPYATARSIVRKYKRMDLAIGKIVQHPTDGRVKIVAGTYFTADNRVADWWWWVKLDEHDNPVGEKRSGHGWM